MVPRIAPATLALAAVVAILAALLFQGAIRWVGTAWVGNPQYTHGFLVVGASIWLGSRALARAPRIAGDPSRRGLAILGMGAVTAAVGHARHDPLISLAGIPFVLLGGAAAFHSPALARRMTFPALLPLVVVPLPGVDVITGALQQWSASLATLLVGALGFDAARSGTRIASGGFLFDVEPMCSGMSGFLSLLALALILGDVRNLAPRARVLMALAVGPVSLALNAVRIAGTVILATWTSPDTALGIFHEASGIALFLAGLALLLTLAGQLPLDPARSSPAAHGQGGGPGA